MEETKEISKTTAIEYVLKNGETVNLSLSFGRLNLLKRVNSELYDRFNKMQFGKSEDILDLVTMIYVAYWCENYKVGDKSLYSEDDFIELVEFDMVEIQRIQNGLTRPKKK